MALTLNIDEASGNRFAGTLLVHKGSDRGDTAIPVEGTLSRAGHLELRGRARGSHVSVSATADDDGVFVGRYRLALPDGTSSEGVATLAADPSLIPVPGVER
jgi:hypothetical protein